MTVVPDCVAMCLASMPDRLVVQQGRRSRAQTGCGISRFGGCSFGCVLHENLSASLSCSAAVLRLGRGVSGRPRYLQACAEHL